MNILIVYSHPAEKSFNAAMRTVAADTLAGLGHEVRISDLYAEHFRPTPDPGAFVPRADEAHFCLMREQEHAQLHGAIEADIAREQGRIEWAEAIIFQFPLWWWSLPAILKGWVDRVLANGFAYGDANLAGKSAMLSVTAETRAERLAGATGQALFERIEEGIFAFCGLGILPRFVVPELGSAALVAREERLRGFAAHLEAVFAAPRGGGGL
jgi:NAD(P)H dehydrogenase (quinone)